MEHALAIGVAAGVLQGLFTQLCSHVVIHTDTLDAAIEAVQHCRQVEFPILTGQRISAMSVWNFLLGF